MDLTTMAALDPDSQVSLWNRAYEGYFVPVHFDAAAIERMRAVGDLDDERSPVLMEGDEPVAFGALGLRGDRAWLGGFGVVANRRRTGLGRKALAAWFDVARRAGARTASLEVLEPNVAAHALYLAHGFRVTRWLDVWSLASPPDAEPPSRVQRVPAADVIGAIEELPSAPDPWQRELSAARRLGDSVVGLRVGGTRDPEGLALVAPGPGRVGVLQMRVARTADPATAQLLLDAALAMAPGGALRWINLDPGDPMSGVLRARGATLEIRQREMALELG